MSQLVLSFDVPLPPRELSSNARVHWRAKGAATAMYRAEVGYSALEASPRHTRHTPEKARVSLLFGIKGGRKAQRYQPRDVPNAIDAFKAGFDGLRDAGILAEDSSTHMELGTVHISTTQGPWVRISVVEVT